MLNKTLVKPKRQLSQQEIDETPPSHFFQPSDVKATGADTLLELAFYKDNKIKLNTSDFAKALHQHTQIKTGIPIAHPDFFNNLLHKVNLRGTYSANTIYKFFHDFKFYMVKKMSNDTSEIYEAWTQIESQPIEVNDKQYYVYGRALEYDLTKFLGLAKDLK